VSAAAHARATRLLESIDLPAGDCHDLPSSQRRFADGGEWRLEIPSTEGPEAMAAVLEEADARGVRVHRVSQGSGVMLLGDDQIEAMLAQGHEPDVEVSLFAGPRALWDVGVAARTPGGAVGSMALRGGDQLAYAVEDVAHACELGVRSVLVADIGLLASLGRLKVGGGLPGDLVLKTSVSLPAGNPATAHLLQELGATTINLPVDMTLAQIAAIRATVDVPLDVYVESADDFGGLLRTHEIAELVRVAAPVYMKFAVRNSAGLYPYGGQLRAAALDSARERVRRADLGLALLRRLAPDAAMSSTSGLLP
jgi:Peptidase family U32